MTKYAKTAVWVAPYSSALDEYSYVKGGVSEYMYIFPNTFVWKLPADMPNSIATLLDPLAVATRTVEMAITSQVSWKILSTPMRLFW